MWIVEAREEDQKIVARLSSLLVNVDGDFGPRGISASTGLQQWLEAY